MAGNTKKFVTKNGLLTQNTEYISPDRTNTINVEMLDSDTLSFLGTTGKLFSVADTANGVNFSVNGISDTTSFEIADDGTIKIAESSGNVLLGTSADNGTDKLQINGSLSANSFSGNLNYSDITNPPIIGNGTLTVTGGSGLSGSGSFDANAETDNTVTLSHANTTTQASVSNTGRTYIQSITLDDYGHIINLSSASESVENANDYLDTLSFNALNGVLRATRTGTLNDITVDLDGRYLLQGSQAVDSDKLDGQQGSYYLNYTNFTNTPAIGDSTLTVEGGSGLSGSGTFDANAQLANTITLSHADTSTVSNLTVGQDKFLSSVSFDGFGHVTAITTSSQIYAKNPLDANLQADSNQTRSIGTSGTRFDTVYATVFDGLATSAKYADLAEIYKTDKDYYPGTVVEFGGVNEVTATTKTASTKVAGVISTNPAYLMNSGATGLPVALAGRVWCRVIGKISAGDFLISSEIPGVARASSEYVSGAVLGKSINNKETDSEELFEILVFM